MKFSLLTPPTDAPSRIPLTRGLPSASAMAVDTGGLPRALPLATVDPDAFAMPYQAMARFAAVGGQVGGDTLNLVMHAEAQKRNADNLAVATNIEYKTSLAFDDALERAKVESDVFSFKPNVDMAWKQISQDAMAQAQAQNPDVFRMVGMRLEGLKAHKYPEVNNTQRTKRLAYYDASLTMAETAATKIITDPGTSPEDRDYQIQNLEKKYVEYVANGMMDDAKVLMHRERHLTTAFNTLAEQSMAANPKAFLPKSEGGEDGYRMFTADGKYPGDAKYIAHLVDTVAPARQLQLDRLQQEADKRREAYTDAHLKRAAQDDFTKLLQDFYSDDPDRVASASARLDGAMNNAQEYWSPGEKTALLAARRDTARQGGVTVPAVFDKLQTDLLRDPASVSRDTILGWAGKGLAVTGTYSVTALLDKRELMLKEGDISQRADYRIGMKVLEGSPVGGAGIMSAAAAYSAGAKAADVIWHGDLQAKAIAEFDRLARTPEWANKSLRELGEMLAAKYTAIMQGGRTGKAGGGDIKVRGE